MADWVDAVLSNTGSHQHHLTPLSLREADYVSSQPAGLHMRFTPGKSVRRFKSWSNLEAKNHARIRLDAQMAKLVDAPASGAGGCKTVEVRVFFWAPKLDKACNASYRPFSFYVALRKLKKTPAEFQRGFLYSAANIAAGQRVISVTRPNRALARPQCVLW